MLNKCAVLATPMIFGFGVPIANATTVTLANTGAGGVIDFTGSPQSFGEAFTAPITGYSTSFTLHMYGVTNVRGVVEEWQGSEVPLFVSDYTPEATSGDDSLTFHPNVKVIQGQQYIAFLSTVGDPYTQQYATDTEIPPAYPAPGINFFVWNPSDKDPLANANWIPSQGLNALFSAEFSDQVPAQPFAGMPGSPNCTGTTVTTLAQTYGDDLAAAAKTWDLQAFMLCRMPSVRFVKVTNSPESGRRQCPAPRRKLSALSCSRGPDFPA
jgi:hypothetical protein